MNIYSSRLSSSNTSKSRYKRSFYVSLSSCFFTCLFQSTTVFSMRYSDAAKRSASETLACTQTCIFRVENVCNAYLHYEQTVSNAIHYTSIVNLKQESVNFAVTYRNRWHFLCSIYVYCTRPPAHITTAHIYIYPQINIVVHRLLLTQIGNSMEI